MSLASMVEQQIARLGGEAKVKLADLRPVLAELEEKLHAAAVVAEPQVKAGIEAALQVAETTIGNIVIAEV